MMFPVKPARAVAALVFLCTAGVGGQTVEVNGIAAVVNNKPITRSEVRNAAQMQIRLLVMERKVRSREALEARAKEIETNALQDLIDKELILDEFRQLGASIRKQNIDEAVNRVIRERFDNDRQQFLGELKDNGLTIQQFRQIQEENIIVQAMRSRNANVGDVIVTPFEIQEFYRSNQELFADEGFVKLRTITIPKAGGAAGAAGQEVLAEEIQQKLSSGAEFGAMARMYSQDSGSKKGGLRGTFARADLNSDLAEAAFTIPVQTVSEVLDLGDNYTIIYVDARDLGEVAPLEEVAEEVRRRVLQNKRQEKVEAWLVRLRDKANIRIY